MADIRVVGAGECGLPLARSLQDGGASVTLLTDRGPEALLAGTVTSTQVKFPSTLDLESTAGLGFWRATAPQIHGIRFTTVADRRPILQWAGHFDRPAQSVDQRTVFARWLTDFVDAGGALELGRPSVAEIDGHAGDYDLTVVTRASGELAECFPLDSTWAAPAGPLRHLSVLYLDGVPPDPDDLGIYVALPELGEVISYPGLTGPPGNERCCEILLFEALPHRPLDVFTPRSTPDERLRLAKGLLDRYLPAALAERYRDADLTDGGATLVGSVLPTMRQAVGTLPSGRPVLGGGDVVCRMDPGGAQGANSAVHCAIDYSAAMLRHSGPYDRRWMIETAAPWLEQIAHPAARWTMAILDPPPAVQRMMSIAASTPSLADTIAGIFAAPATMAALAAGAEPPAL